MRLKRLTVQGFKSFRDRTTILFSGGITGIVGPNGCGKSNIVDALFWVMGEQSAKHLRGDAMRDLIFSGSSKHSPASFAEATLVLDNEKGRHIRIGPKIARPSEIALTRKLYRNGESDYRINNEPARLRDIQEVFMGTGTGAKSYSIIAQGEIEKLIQAKAVERRAIIEEVAGVTKFKQRRKESLRKIDQTQANLTRLGDLREGVEKGLKQLERQAERAERAQDLRNKIRSHELVSNSHRLFALFKDYGEDKAASAEKSRALLEWQSEKRQLENSLKGERDERDEKSGQLQELQGERNNASKKLASIETRLSLLSRQKEEKLRELMTRRRETEDFLGNTEERMPVLTELEEKRDRLTANEDGTEGLEKARENIQRLEDDLRSRGEEIEQTKNELDEIGDLKAAKGREIFGLQSTLESQAASLEDLDAELGRIENGLKACAQEADDERESLALASSKLRTLKEDESEKKRALHALSFAIRNDENSLAETRRHLADKRLALGRLVAANPSLEGAKAFLEGDQKDGFCVLGALIEEVPDRYSAGVDALLGGIADTLLCEEKPPEFTSIPSHEIGFITPDTATDPPTAGDFLPLADAIGVRQGYGQRIKELLRGFYLTEEIEEQDPERWIGVPFKAVSNFEGTKIVKRVAGALVYSFVPPKKSERWPGKGRLLEELSASIEESSAHIKEAEESLRTKRKESSQLEGIYERVRDEAVGAEKDYTARRAVSELKGRSLRDQKERKQALEQKRETLLERRRLYLARQGDIRSSSEQLGHREEVLQERYEALLEEEENLRDHYRGHNEAYLRQKAEAASYQDRLENLDGRIGEIKLQIARDEERIGINKERIRSYEEEISETSSEIEELGRDAKETASEIERRELFIQRVTEDLDDLAAKTAQREERIKHIYAQINRYEKELIGHKNRMENAVSEEQRYTRDTFEKYRVDLRESLVEALDSLGGNLGDFADLSSMYVMETEQGSCIIAKEPFSFVRKYGKALTETEAKLKRYKNEYSRIGDINWQAIDDYERQKHRWEFLKAQEDELERSLEDLQKAIVHIDEKSKTRFKSAFGEVNARFEKVFPIIFGGGSARLEIAGDLDDPDCGIDIIASPPGKKMQNINLMSGGEKALTAVGLIFSIFLVKPSPFCLLDEVDAPLDDANVGRFNELLREMSQESQFILVTHNKRTMELNDTLYGITMQEPGISKAVSVQLQ